jgi:hypothetical protein
MFKNIVKVSLVFFFLCSSICISTSKGAGMGMGNPPNPCGGIFPPCPVPLDGGVSLLLIAGAAYGGKKINDSVKKNPS